MSAPVTRRRNKLAPDPDTRRAILAAASESLREQGVQGLSIAAVLQRAELSTRAFYRHFESKDQLVSAVFVEMARTEKRRLRRRMAAAGGPVEAVAAWIDGRLDLAFSESIKSDLRHMSLEAQSQSFAVPRADPAGLRRDARATHRPDSARSETRCVPRCRPDERGAVDTGVVWAAPNGNGQRATASVQKSDNAHSDSACVAWA